MSGKQFPPPGTKAVASEFIVTGGGCAADAPLAVTRFSGHAAHASRLDGVDDAVSERMLQDLVAEGINCPVVQRATDQA